MNVNKYDYLNLCSKSSWEPKNGMSGTVYRRHYVTNGIILHESILPPANDLSLNSYKLCIILISNKYYVPIKSTGIECFQESTYL